MGKILNEVTGPRVFVVDNGRGSKLHITGGYGQPDMKQALCGANIKVTKVLDPRDTAARDGYQDYNMWCTKCMGLLDFEALDQKILFSAIEWPAGTTGQLIIAGHLTRRKPKLRLTPPPATPTTYKIGDVASPQPVITSRIRKPATTGGAVATAPIKKKRKTRSDKGVPRGPRNKSVPPPTIVTPPQPTIETETVEEGSDV